MTSPWHRERSDPLWPLGTGGIGSFHDGAGRRSAGSHDDPGARVGNFRRLKTGILDRLLHRNVIPRRPLAEEAHRSPIDDAARIERGRALHLGAEPELGIFVRARNAGLRLMEARKHFLGVVSDGRDNAHPRDDNPPHDRLILSLRFCVMAVVKPKAASSACRAQVSYVPSCNAASCLNRPTFKSFAR